MSSNFLHIYFVLREIVEAQEMANILSALLNTDSVWMLEFINELHQVKSVLVFKFQIRQTSFVNNLHQEICASRAYLVVKI